MTTARDIITSALRLRLNRLSPGEALDDDTADLCLSALNEVSQGLRGLMWRVDMIPSAEGITTAPAVLGTHWPTLRPGCEVQGVTVHDAGQDWIVTPITLRQYHEYITGKLSTGRPEVYALDGHAGVYLWPIPTGQVVTLRTRGSVSAFDTLDTVIDLPDGYASHLSALLAEAVAEVLTGALSAGVARAAAMARRAMLSATVDPHIIRPPTMVGTGDFFGFGPSAPDGSGGESSSCPVAAPTFADIGDTSATLILPSLPACAASLEYRVGAGVWMPAAGGDSVALTGLAPGSDYAVAVHTVAPSGVRGDDAVATLTTTLSPPVIVDEPDSVTLSSGASLTLSVAATGTAPLSYVWDKGGVPIVGATSATYTVGTVSTADAGTYHVTVSNAGGSVPSVGAVVVVTLPMWDPSADRITVNSSPASDSLIVYSNGGRTATNTSTAVLSDAFVAHHTQRGAGRWYFELTCTHNGNGVSIGWASNESSPMALDNAHSVRLKFTGSLELYGAAGVVVSSAFVSFAVGVRYRFAIDSIAGKVWIARNAEPWVGGGDPAAGTSPTLTGTVGTGRAAATILGSSGGYNQGSVTVHSDASAVAYAVPAGFTLIGGVA